MWYLRSINTDLPGLAWYSGTSPSLLTESSHCPSENGSLILSEMCVLGGVDATELTDTFLSLTGRSSEEGGGRSKVSLEGKQWISKQRFHWVFLC